MPDILTSDADPLQLGCDVLVIPARRSEDGTDLGPVGTEVDARLDGALAAHLDSIAYKPDVGRIALVTTLGRLPARALAVCGVGDGDAVAVRRAAGCAARVLRDHAEIVSLLHSGAPGAAGAAAEGFLLGSYAFTTYKSDPHPSRLQRVTMAGAEAAALERAAAHADATVLARDLTNTPASDLTPEGLARRAREVADATGLDCTILDEQELQRRGFGGLLGVARGSVNPPRLITLRYSPESARGRVALVGKGVTFDSGGLSLKDPKNMEQMKTDMAGAAAVLATMSALGRLGVGREVLGVIPATENLPGRDALKPGDVLHHYGGRTTEVLNTDAEGRLILADALVYACEHRPDAIVDLATLTGAIVVALGAKRSGLFCNDDGLAEALLSSAAAAGERLWRMPLDPDFETLLDSEIADQRNTSGSRHGGAVFAAMFLRRFVADGVRWAHLDIAGPARAEADYDEVPRGGTGVGVRTLLRWLEEE